MLLWIDKHKLGGNMTVRLFEDSRAIDSMRSSDFDALSAYGEVVDNSIQANARKININFDLVEGNRGYQKINRIFFADNGEGMDTTTLHSCLKLGFSTRYDNRDGIGRFGVGMTLAAIHECKRVEVYSKIEGGEWLYTYIDLDEIKSGTMDLIPAPIEKTPSNAHLVEGDSGTLVIWSKYDRQERNAKLILEDAGMYFGRTFRYFIWDDDVEIYLNNEWVPAHDPLYTRTEKTKFPNDPQAEAYDDMSLMWEVDEVDSNLGRESEIVIKTSLLPEEWRMNQGAGGSAEVKARRVDDNEGISILRNRREVFYGHIPYWKNAGPGWSQWEDKDRWWGCEIQFDAILDRAFTVKILSVELCQYLN